MFLPQWLRQFAHRWSLPTGRRSVPLLRRTRKLTRPFLERLEDRLAPATVPANTTVDFVKEFTIPTPNSQPTAITEGSDGNLWFTETKGNKIGEFNTATKTINEFSIPTPNSQPQGIVALGSTLFFTEANGNKIGEFNTTTDTFSEFPLPTNYRDPTTIYVGPGGIWFSEVQEVTGPSVTGMFDPETDTFSVLNAPGGAAYAGGWDPVVINEPVIGGTEIVHGVVWITEPTNPGGLIVAYDPATDQVIGGGPGFLNAPYGIQASGSPSPLWITEESGNDIVRYDLQNAANNALAFDAGDLPDANKPTTSVFPIPTPDSQPEELISGPDGMYFNEVNGNKIGVIDALGTISEFSIPTPDSQPQGMVADGSNVWFTEANGNKIGYVTIPLVVTNTNDSGPGSLRAEIASAHSGETIIFDPSLAGQTITLTSGELEINKNLDIENTQSSPVTISGNNASRVFEIGSEANLTIAGLDIVNGDATATASDGSGGGIENFGTLTVSNSSITNNTAGGFVGFGGGIENDGTLTVSNSTITNNTAYAGGGIMNNDGTLTVSNSIIDNNTVSAFGGGIFDFGTATVSNSTIDNNTAIIGGGIDSGNSSPRNEILTLTNSTIANNTAYEGGGGILCDGTTTVSNSTINNNTTTFNGGGGINNDGTLTVSNSTLANNTANGGYNNGGGGIINFENGPVTISYSTIASNYGGGIDNYGGGMVTAFDTIIASNSGNPSSDVYGNLTSLGHNLIGNTSGGSGFAATDLLNLNPLLSPLGNYGGPTQTMAVLPGSPAIDAGDNTNASDTDQRGFSRTVNGKIDIGAFESQGFTILPSSGDNQNVPTYTPFAQQLVVSVTANNPVEPVAGGLITFTAPASGASAGFIGSPATIGPDGKASITAAANGTTGTYMVSASATGAASPASFSLTNTVGQPNWVVTTLLDEDNPVGTMSLRQAITYAEEFTGPQTITFDPSILTQPTGNVIDLTSALPDLTGNITIAGPGPSNLAISGNFQSRVFTIDEGSNANLAGLTIEDGFDALGGGIANLGGTVTLSNCTVSDNSAILEGGGIANLGGTMTLSNCIVSDNNSLVVSPDVNGGGVYNASGTLTVKNSTFAGNYGELGGGIENFGTAMVSNCTFSGNGAVLGGGIDTFDPLTVDNCSFSGNSALVGGGIFTFGSTLTVSNSTLADNSANNGGGIANENGGSATLNNTIVADSTSGGDLYLDSGYGSTFTGSNDLIGDGSDLISFTNSLQGNPLLAPLGNYGGPTQTMALLPGSLAIDAGSNALAVDASGNPLTTDERGQPRIVGSVVDIGAFESQGFTLTASNGRVQTTDINTNFPNSLTVTVTPNNPLEPVNGGIVTFTAPNTGASATLSANTSVISDGSASVTATANGTAGGPYTVTATASGMSNSASFYLTNVSGPTSQVVPGSLATIQTSDTFTVSVTFSDPAGVASVDLYDSNNGGKTWTLYQNLSANGATSGTLNFSFTGQDRNIYDFYSIAHSVSGDVQSTPSSLIEASTDVPDFNPPVTHALTTSSYNSSNGIFTITWAGADPDQNTGTPPGSIATVAVFVSVDGGAYQQVGTAQSAGSPNANGVYSGSLTYNALADGNPHSYSFYTLGTDDLGVSQAVPSAPDVTFSNISYTAPLAVTALNVVQNETQTTPLTERSYIRYLEVNFNQSPTINAPNFLSNLGSNVELLYFGTNGTMQGSVSLSNVTATLNGTSLFLDFGANGITSALTLNGGQTAPSSPTSNTFGDGWYALGISSSATGTSNPIWVPFFRLLGSASGDTTVTGTATGADYQLVAGAVGKAYNANADLNGDGSVNLNDVKYVKTSNTHTAGVAPTSFPQFQLFAGAPTSGQATPITESEVQALLPQAIAAWQAAGLNAANVQLMKQANVQVADLNGNILGLEQGGEIWINDTAAGYGWYVGGSVAANEVDLLTVLEHELGHIVGLADNSLTGDLMNTSLGLGVRRTPTVQDVARIAVNTNTAQTSMETAGNNGMEAESLTLRDFLFTLLSNPATLDQELFSYTYPLMYWVSDAS